MLLAITLVNLVTLKTLLTALLAFYMGKTNFRAQLVLPIAQLGLMKIPSVIIAFLAPPIVWAALDQQKLATNAE